MDPKNGIVAKLWGDVPEKDWNSWRWQFAHRLKSPELLPEAFFETAEERKGILEVSAYYPFRVTPYYLGLMETARAADPVRIQCIPQRRELDHADGCDPDPLGEGAAMPVPGLIHRYPDRCLVLVHPLCAVHCRHCNRKRFWGSGPGRSEQDRFGRMVDYVRANRRIREVIFSGGDPLTLGDRKLDALLGAFRGIPHVDVLRIGSRMPVVLPMRITGALCRVLARHRPLWFNTQFNHVNEITKEAARACEMLLQTGIPVSNQSVLLRGVNDSFEAMRDLLYGLQRISVRPYYLFQCEPVAGAGHFRVKVGVGKTVMERIWRECSGLCQPSYVIDTIAGRGKIPLPLHSSLSCDELACYGNLS
ncbi:MAG TPA: KamA family radical SAM protein [Syntrophales bacterium]|jgi:lysine 2,3-aminomutase|nr:KamA family radical SAM protein [Syntrophales bacterium]